MSEKHPKQQEPDEATANELDEETLDEAAGGLTVGNLDSSVISAFPDVCKTPTTDGPTATPYPELADATKDDAKTTKLSNRTGVGAWRRTWYSGLA